MLILPFLFLLGGSCSEDPAGLAPAEMAIGQSRAYGAWTPGPGDSCTREIHDSYSVVGPDGMLYPTWHPPVDPATGCQFGHEHGRDPSGSALFGDVGPIPFGLANTALDVHEPSAPRHEDHVGHKIEWANGFQLDVRGTAGALFQVTCDVLAKLHQGTHSKDAFTNNMHELVYHLRCSDGTELHVTMLTPIGTPGQFRASCERGRTVPVGTATPPTSPDGGGHRAIPDRSCIDRFLFVAEGDRSHMSRALRESWETHSSIKTADGRTLARFDPYFQVENPSRYFDPSLPDGVGRTVDLCREEQPGGRRIRSEDCDLVRSIPDLTHDDPRSPFDGADRFIDINGNRIRNGGGPEIWYTDPLGRDARTEPFPGSIRQFIAAMDNSGIDTHGPILGKERDYGGSGVHAPN